MLIFGADVGAVLNSGNVARVGPGEVRVGALGFAELAEGALLYQQLAERFVLLGRAVAPDDALGFRHRGDLIDPGDKRCVLGWNCCIGHVLEAPKRPRRRARGGALVRAA